MNLSGRLKKKKRVQLKMDKSSPKKKKVTFYAM